MPAPISIAHLEFRLSGGSANTDPNASLGGDMSSERIQAQSTTALSNITGVVINYAAGNSVGAGTLAWDATAKTLTWTPNAGSAGTAVDVNTNGDGRYTVFGASGGYLCVTVTNASTPGTNQSDSVTIANVANETFDDVTKAESFAGDSEYRAIYLYNAHATDPFLNIIPYIGTQPNPGVMSIGKSGTGVGDGVTRSVISLTRSGTTATAQTSAAHGYATGQTVTIAGAAQSQYNGAFTITVTASDTFTYTVSGSPATPATGTITAARGVAVTIADEGVAPAGVTFYSPGSTAEALTDGLGTGQLNPGECIAIWEKRSITPLNTTSNTASLAQTRYQSYY